MTVFVGIDIAKESHVACIMNALGEVSHPISFENNVQGFSKLISNIVSFDKKDVVFGFESTAHYHKVLEHFLNSKGYITKLMNPLEVIPFRKANIRNTKNDKVDAQAICLALYHSQEKSRQVSKHNDFYNLCLSRHDLVTLKSRCKIKLTSYLDIVFPELAKYFKGNLHINTCYQLLKKYPSPIQIKETRIDVLERLLFKSSKGKYSKAKAIELKKLANNSVGITTTAISTQIQLCIHQIEFYEDQIAQIEQLIEEYVVADQPLILSIPGISTIFAGYILSSISNILDFSTSSKLIAYSGLDPIVRQSGNFNAIQTRMSKRGKKLLRYALIWSAWNVVRNNKTFKDYYDKKRSLGKSHYNALGHCAAKLVRCIHTMYHKNEEFNLE
ncbi:MULTISPECIES: IS110 family transposase [unclassified Breznakia]|nr:MULTISPECIES: IS110 family transposase [unclassified Breznakia]